jgi:hypothetical protein
VTPDSPILSDVLDEARRLLDAATTQNVVIRLFGGTAVQMRVPGQIAPCFVRVCRDIDLVILKRKNREVASFLTSVGYEANERFNAMNGAERMVFYDVAHQRQLDVFVGSFEMCHRIPVADRLHASEDTLPLAELLLTKLQIFQLNRKDLIDIWCLLYYHDVTASDEDDAINGVVAAKILSGDWGLWRTVQQSIQIARERLGELDIDDEGRRRIKDRLSKLWSMAEAEPKNLKWRSRSKVGERIKWYLEPEEIAHVSLEGP